jgi:pantoate--beta-alanine ligase
LGFVPTMGALHEGHAELVRQAAAECPTVIVSIYVNPTQFGPGEDFACYPRTEDDDLALLESVGASVVFLPSDIEMYPGHETKVCVKGAAIGFEGDQRPGHFDGVATVVAKLFLMTGCDIAYFGLKDLQQCAVVRQVVRDLCFAVTLRFIETVRDETGLALSSRNRYLSVEQRSLAASLFQVLIQTGRAMLTGTSVLEACEFGKRTLRGLGFEPEYLDLVNPETMLKLDEPVLDARLVVAARLSGVRLIDNMALRSVQSA